MRRRLIECGLLLALPGLAVADERMVFTGDILLSRQVAAELAQSHRQPWSGVAPALAGVGFVAGNLEGSVGESSQCLPALPAELCFAVPPELLSLPRQAGFTALGTANNHSGDLGAAGRTATASALAAQGLAQLDFAHSPQFFALGNYRVGLVSLSRVKAADGQFQALNLELEQKLSVAAALADSSGVMVHWGTELADWPSPQQYQEAGQLLGWGADFIIGHHPHVVQAPVCLAGHPVFFSLGNHVFDQKYAATKQGLLANCTLGEGRLNCAGIATHTPALSAFPVLDTTPPKPVCSTALHAGLVFGDIRVAARPSLPDDAPGSVTLALLPVGQPPRYELPHHIRRIASMRLAVGEAPSLMVLEDHFSSMDGRVAPRPYLYRVTPQGLRARWRGTALAYPLLDVAVLPGVQADVLCALHGGGSFLVPAPDQPAHSMAYVWNGFGFAAAPEAAQQACQQHYLLATATMP